MYEGESIVNTTTKKLYSSTVASGGGFSRLL